MAKCESKQDGGADAAHDDFGIVVNDPGIILLRRFVKTFEPCLSETAAEAFTELLEEGWLQAIFQHNLELCADDILTIKESATSLHRCLTELLSKADKWTGVVGRSHIIRAEIGTASYDRLDGEHSLYEMLNLELENGASIITVAALSDALSIIIKTTELDLLRSSKRAPNRPLGIRNYPALDMLVHALGIWSQTHLPQRFTAYVKTSGETKIATGSLIRMLDSLREFFASNHQMAWCANYLPTMSEHPTYMSTYQRALRAAFYEGLETSDPTEP